MTQTNPAIEDQIQALAASVAQLAQQVQNAPASVEAAAVTDQSTVAPPAVGSLVSQVQQVAGQDTTITVYGIVCAVDPQTNSARVGWFNATTDVRGDELTKVE